MISKAKEKPSEVSSIAIWAVEGGGNMAPIIELYRKNKLHRPFIGKQKSQLRLGAAFGANQPRNYIYKYPTLGEVLG